MKCPICKAKIDELDEICPRCKTNFDDYEKRKNLQEKKNERYIENEKVNADYLNIMANIDIILTIISAIATFFYDFSIVNIVSTIVILISGFTIFFLLKTVVDIYYNTEN